MSSQSANRPPGRIVSRSASPLTTGTWVLIAGGEKALFLENIGDAERPILEVRREQQSDNPPTREQGTDRAGRMPDAGSHHRSAMEQTDWHRLERTRFVHELAEMLYARAHAGRFSRLIVVASPAVLGELRPRLHPEVRARIVGELDLDLTSLPVDEIARRIGEQLSPA